MLLNPENLFGPYHIWSQRGSWCLSSFMKGCLPWDSVVIHSFVFSSILILIFLFKLLLCPHLNYWWSLSFHQWPLLPVLWTFLQFSSAQSLSRVRLFATPWTAAHQACMFITNSQSPPKPMSIELVMPSNHLILCGPLLPPSIFPSIRVFSNESALRVRCIGVSGSASVLPMNTQDWFPLGLTGWIFLQAKGLSTVYSNTTVKKHQCFGAQLSLLRLLVQLSYPYMTTGKTITLTRQTFVGKIMSLLFNMLSRLAITFLPRSKCLLISWLQSPSAVILEAPQNKVWYCFHCFPCFPIYFPWSDGTRCHDLRFLNVEL